MPGPAGHTGMERARTHIAQEPPIVRYAAAYTFPVAPDELWSELEQLDRFESWWHWLEQFTARPARLEPGAVLSGIVRPPVPYQMRLRVELQDCVRPRWVRAHVSGDLLGDAVLELLPVDTGTEADVSWTLQMRQPAMRIAARFARPLLCWGHDRVVDATVAGFRRHLAR